MIQHLLNTTAIWLLCLLIYDVFFRKETFHRYNRLYLLSSLILGVALPAISWQSDTMVYHTPLSQPLQELATVKQSIETTIVPGGDTFNSGLIIWFVYLVGVLFSLVLIGKDVFLLVRLYRKSAHQKEGRWTVITTNEPHGPFSIFNYLFVGNRKLYDKREWQLLLQHEQQHASHFHFIDLLVMQLARTVLWFHPLVYVYQQRLLLIHEYQADIVGAETPAEYGTFLVEQAMLQGSPAITHSFNRSPIKKRIIMLTKRSSKSKMLKPLAAIPVALCCILCFTNNVYSNKKGKGDGNVVTFKGNTIEFEGAKRENMLVKRNDNKDGGSVMVVGKEANEETIEITFSAAPIRVNGDTIYSAGDVSKEPRFLGKDKTLTHYLFNSVKNELGGLEDGEYFIHISYPVVDRKGTLVYYNMEGVTLGGTGKIDNDAKNAVDKKLNEALDNAPKYEPAQVNGKAVAWYDAWGVELGYRITVKGHAAKLEYKEPRPFRP